MGAKTQSKVLPNRNYEDKRYWILPSGAVVRWFDIFYLTPAVGENGEAIPTALALLNDGKAIEFKDPRDIRALRSAFLAISIEID